MKDFVSQIISSIIVVSLAYLAGYKLRQYVPKGRRFFVGFVVVLSFITIAFAIVLGLPMIARLTTSVATEAVIGFSLGIAGPQHR